MPHDIGTDDWWPFQRELEARGIAPADIENVEIVPEPIRDAPRGAVVVIVTLRSGAVESWRQARAQAA